MSSRWRLCKIGGRRLLGESTSKCQSSRLKHVAAQNIGGTNDNVPEHEKNIPKREVERFMISCMETVGTPTAHAQLLAMNLSEADYVGHFSHGLNRLEMYIKDIQAGMCDPKAEPSVLKEGPATAWVDGNNGLGVVVGRECMNLAIEKAKTSGIGWVAAKNSTHFGICQFYTNMALREGFIGMSSTNTGPAVCPTRSRSKIFGTNPFCVSAPGHNSDRFLLDMSTSSVAVGKIEMQMRRGEPLPTSGWALGADGEPTKDAKEAFFDGKGLMPLGGTEVNSGYKGYGLGMFVELICSLMSGADYAHKVRKWQLESDRPSNLGQCFVAIDPDCFAPGMSDRLQDLMSHLRHLSPTDPSRPVLVPGDPERLAAEGVDRRGYIEYTADHITCYRRLAEELGVKPMQHVE